MNVAGGIRCATDDIEGLKREIGRRDRILQTLIAQAERGCDPTSGEAQLHALTSLEHLVRKRTAELRRSVSELEMFIRNAPAGILFTRDHVILRYNQQFGIMFGLDGDEGIGQSTRILFRSDQEFESAKQRVEPVLSASKTHSNDVFMRHKNGADIWIHTIGYAVADEKPGISAVWMMEDRTATKIAEEALNRNNAELQLRNRELARRELEIRTIIANAYDAYIACDSNAKIAGWNQQAEITFGWSAEEVMGRPLHEVCIPPELWNDYFENLRTGIWVDQRLELPALYRDRSRFMIEIRIGLVEFEGVRTFYAFLHDITERKANEARREFEAVHDALTGLPNRRGLMAELPLAIARAERSARDLAVLFLDLDGFKEINDRYGHDVGDGVLQEVACRLRYTLRQTDLATRLAGDEFVVILENLTHAQEDAPQYAQRLIEALSAPMTISGQTFTIGASIGILGRTPEDRISAQNLLKRADEAMYHAKRAGKGCYFMLHTQADEPGSRG